MSASSVDIVAALVCWLRFSKQMPYTATEMELGRFRADVFGAHKSECIEVEVKVSMRDLKREFETKKGKHRLYSEDNSGWKTPPNRVYFAVPHVLKDHALELLETKAPQYGLLFMQEDNFYHESVPWKLLRVAKSAKWLHRERPKDSLLSAVLDRMGSEIAHFHLGRSLYFDAFDRIRELSRAMAPPTSHEMQPIEGLE